MLNLSFFGIKIRIIVISTLIIIAGGYIVSATVIPITFMRISRYNFSRCISAISFNCSRPKFALSNAALVNMLDMVTKSTIIPYTPCATLLRKLLLTKLVTYGKKDEKNSKITFHHITFLLITFASCHSLCRFIHIVPSQKNDNAYAKNPCFNANIASYVGSAGFSNSKIRLVIIIARTASVKAINLFFAIKTLLHDIFLIFYLLKILSLAIEHVIDYFIIF